MSTSHTDASTPRQSFLAKTTESAPKSSPESLRQSFMFLISLLASGLSGYFTATLPGASTPRIIMAGIFAGWLSLIVHTARSVSASRHI